MNSSIGHILLILLFSTVELIKEGASNTYNDEETVEDGSQKSQEGEAGEIWGLAGRQIFPQLEEGPQYQQNVQQRETSGTHAHGEIELDLSNLSEEMGVSKIRAIVDQLQSKVDSVFSLISNTVQWQTNDFNNRPLKILDSKADYLIQAAQTLFVGLQSINNQMKTQQQLLEESASNKRDTRGFAQQFQTLREALKNVSQEVEEVKICESEAMKFILQAVVRNSETLANIQNGVTSTYNSCSARCVQQQPQAIPIQQPCSSDDVAGVVSEHMRSLTQTLVRALHEDMAIHTNRVMQHAVQRNEEIKSYLLDLAKNMMDYRDEFITRLLEQDMKMEVIKKTVTETTHVMQEAAAGAQNAANQMASSARSAQRSLEGSSMCKNKKVKGK